MYIKVTVGDGHGDFIQEVGPGPLESGTIAVEWDPDAEDNNVLAKVAQELDIVWSQARLLEIDPQQTRYELNTGVAAVRYVWWYVPDSGAEGVVTTRNIFIVGNDGKTIDRVR